MTLKLDRLDPKSSYINPQGQPLPAMTILWQRVMNAIETAILGLAQAIDDIEEAEADILAIDATIDTINTNVTNAQNDATQGKNSGNALDLLASFVSPTACLTAADAGASATVTVANHDRVYLGSTVAVTGAPITALAYSTRYHVYYDQPSRNGGAVTYATASTAVAASRSSVNTHRHYVGTILTPAALAADTAGTGALPPSAILG